MANTLKIELKPSPHSSNQDSIVAQMIQSIEPLEIPAAYIDHIDVHYRDGTYNRLSGDQINLPIPVNPNPNWRDMESHYAKVRNVYAYINTDLLELHINSLIEYLFAGKVVDIKSE